MLGKSLMKTQGVAIVPNTNYKEESGINRCPDNPQSKLTSRQQRDRRYLCKRRPSLLVVNKGGHSVASVVFLPNTHNPVILRKEPKRVSGHSQNTLTRVLLQTAMPRSTARMRRPFQGKKRSKSTTGVPSSDPERAEKPVREVLPRRRDLNMNSAFREYYCISVKFPELAPCITDM